MSYTHKAPCALILAGGKSRRMGTDKAQLLYEGQTLLARTQALLSPFVVKTFLSVALDDDRDYSLPTLRDLSADIGPLAGLQAAFQHDAQVPWLVVACDLPLLDATTVSYLLEKSSTSAATAFRNRHDQRAEPLCALYPPAAVEPLNNYLYSRKRCARHFLESLDPLLLDLPNPIALDNANRPEHLLELKLLNTLGLKTKTINVTYYGKLSSEGPTNPETLTTTAATLAGLYEELRLRHRLSLDLDVVKPVMADEFVEWTAPLIDNADVAFLPPFAGG